MMCEGLAKLLAPILPVTADDLWRHIPGERSASVHLEDFPTVEGLVDKALLEEWDQLLSVREQVNGALEQKRKDKVIGTSLGARVVLKAKGPIAALLDRHRAGLPMLLNVSEVSLAIVSTTGDSAVDVETEKAPGVKCARCWRFVPSVRSEPEWAGICDRCVDALGGGLAA
jgi:isoleucyl-tRNA synthetase